jgi:hypothetical protein
MKQLSISNELVRERQNQTSDPPDEPEYDKFAVYRIAELTVAIRGGGKVVTELGESYRITDNTAPDVTVNLSKEFLINLQKKHDHISVDKWAHETTGLLFYKSLVDFDGFMLHASAVVLDGKAYLFSAPSGTGKSTHTSLWLKSFGHARAYIINDDKPALRLENGAFYVYGTPWSGKGYLNTNIKVPLQAIVFLRQAKENQIRRLTGKEAVPMLISQSLRPNRDTEKMEKLLSLLNRLLTDTPVYQLDCTISHEAVKLVYDEINKAERGTEV